MIAASTDLPVRQVAVEHVRFAVRRREPARPRRNPAALCLHGVPQTGSMWAELATELARDRIVIAPDLKGLGASEATGSYRVDQLAVELAALALHEVDGPIDVIGHDWGGVIAIALASARPELVRRLVVIDAPYRRVQLSRAPHLPFFALPLAPEAAFAIGGGRLVELMIRYGWRAERPPEPALLATYVRAYQSRAQVGAMLAYYRDNLRPWLRREWSLAGWSRGSARGSALGPSRGSARGPARGSARGPASPPALPKLVVWGAADPVLPMPVAEAAVRNLGADTRLLSVPGAGHFVVEEAPEVVVPAVAEFLRAPNPH